jgi:cyclic pyranopterin phosphate synthase
MTKKQLSHLDQEGKARMVDVGAKESTRRSAVARGKVIFSAETLAIARGGDLKKGDLRSVAELAGVMAAKKTSELIPLCHPLNLDHIELKVQFREDPPGVEIVASVQTEAKTGVEMEALTGVAAAALTVYDMIKGVDKTARIDEIRVVEKHGGRGGDFVLE